MNINNWEIEDAIAIRFAVSAYRSMMSIYSLIQ